MGKKRFIDRKKDVVHTIVLSNKNMSGADPIFGALPAPTKKKDKPMKAKAFQLRCDLPEDPSPIENSESNMNCDTDTAGEVKMINFSEDFPALGGNESGFKSSVKRKKGSESATKVHNTASTSQSLSSPNSSAWKTNIPSSSCDDSYMDSQQDDYEEDDSCSRFKFARYGIYFDDDYDYGQHLRDPNDWPLAEEDAELQTIVQQHPQARKKNPPKKLDTIPETFKYEAPAFCDPSHSIAFEEEATADPYDELFDDADEGELPDDIVDLLGGEDLDEDEDCSEDESNSDGVQDTSDGFLNVSDDEEAGNSDHLFDDAESLPEEQSSDAEDRPVADGDVKAAVDGFFDSVGFTSPEDDVPQSPKIPALRSSKGAKMVTDQFEHFNNKFDAMILRDYKDSDVGDARLDEVDGYLADDASQVSQFGRELRSVKYRDENVALVGPNKEPESLEDEQSRRQALQFCKTFTPSTPKTFEVSVPDRSAMKYNVTNLPSIRTKNKPIIIKNELPYLSRGKKKGLSVKDLKQHDAEFNTPHREVDEEAQTYKTMISELSYRPPDETTEQHRQRKAALKEIRRARREEKKQNTLALRNVLIHTSRVNINANRCQGVPLI
ncbi:protein LTV1 homolog [Hyalella azteca]|uniref:Protein LTV1 homolog n=1 Tax=Hyalella azteca TaxID=294128 RepID=A0A8B7NGD0_HYAAZ|nr:protein LTV1 homolog [Hyalella azteca]